MIITHYGAEFFKVSVGDTILAFNPISKDSKLKENRFGSDIVLISNEHADMNGAEQMTHGEKEPFVIRGPGEYEVQDVLIKGYQTTTAYGGEERINTAYLVRFDKMLILYMGAINTTELPKELKEVMDKIDVLFVPIGGDGVLEPKKAHEFAVSVGPKIIIPMHHDSIGIKDALKTFLKEEAATTNNHKPIHKLTIKTKDLEDKENEIFVFSSKA